MELLQGVSDIIQEISEKVILPKFQDICKNRVINKTPADLVTAADIDSEMAFFRELPKIIPDSQIVSEELSDSHPVLLKSFQDSKIQNLWVIDPLDGTTNFIEGKENFAVAVSLITNGKTKAAWIYLPYKKQMLCGDEKHGLFLNNKKFEIENKKRKIENIDTNRLLLPYIKPSFNLIRASSCSCSYFNLITQKIDAIIFSKKLLPWDHVAGTFLHKCSGGFNAYIDGTEYSPSKKQHNTLIMAPDRKSWMELRGQTQIWLERLTIDNQKQVLGTGNIKWEK